LGVIGAFGTVSSRGALTDPYAPTLDESSGGEHHPGEQVNRTWWKLSGKFRDTSLPFSLQDRAAMTQAVLEGHTFWI
jgi:hypothetical protein